MTDEQVMEYVQQGLAEGKDREEMIADLTLRGVTRAQAMRIYSDYQSQSSHNTTVAEQNASRVHSSTDAVDESQVNSFVSDNSNVFGRNIFSNRSLNFSPSENMATPRNYRLGPGDEVIIDVFGRNQTTLRGVISPEGNINVDILGPLYLNGMTIDEANTYLKKRLSQIYGGLGHSGTDMRLSLGQIRSIQVNILGDVNTPGTYRLSSFASAYHALYRAGGVKEPGTLRDIKIVRGDKVVGSVDIYEFLMKGNLSKDIRLEEGDVILVAPYKSMVSVEGGVKRPMFFEMKAGEKLSDLFEYAGGFTNGANTASVTVYRQSQKSFEVRTVDESEYSSFPVRNGDRIEVGTLQSRFENRISIQGAVFFPGTYELGEVHTLKGLIEKAGGLLPEAFTDRVVVHREYPDLTKEVFSVNLTSILGGTKADVELQNNDEIIITSATDLNERGTMTISGMVRKPGAYPFAENTTVEDLIIMAGGLQDGASLSRVDVTRRKRDESGLVATKDLGEVFSFSIDGGLIQDGKGGFVLEPYDVVTIHRSPSYNVARSFSVHGEVNFPATYTITSREERISDLIERAGGLTDFAYKEGTRLVRRATAEELRQAREMIGVIKIQMDSAQFAANDASSKALAGTYTIAVDLKAAIENPGGDADVVLRDDDVLEIPSLNNVVRIYGAVNYPTAVNYDGRMKGRDYVNSAGGYRKDALRRKAYVVNMSGRAKKLRGGTAVEPGSEIYIPIKEKKSGDSSIDYRMIIALSSAASTLGTIAVTTATLVNAFKK